MQPVSQLGLGCQRPAAQGREGHECGEVQIMAASGRTFELRREAMDESCVVWREAAREAPWGAGSTMAVRVVLRFDSTDSAWRGPMRPPPTTTI